MIDLLKYYGEPIYFWLDEVWLEHKSIIVTMSVLMVCLGLAFGGMIAALNVQAKRDALLMAMCIEDGLPEYKCAVMILQGRAAAPVVPVVVPMYGG